MTLNENNALKEIIGAQFGIEYTDTENIDLLDVVAQRVAELLDNEPELLFSSLYRLDVDENKVRHTIEYPTEEPVNYRIARLILDRQRQRIQTKLSYKPPKIEGWEF